MAALTGETQQMKRSSVCWALSGQLSGILELLSSHGFSGYAQTHELGRGLPTKHLSEGYERQRDNLGGPFDRLGTAQDGADIQRCDGWRTCGRGVFVGVHGDHGRGHDRQKQVQEIQKLILEPPFKHVNTVKYDPVDTKRRVVEAAIDLFGKRGFAGTMYDAIEKQAKAARGSITHHFGKKSDLAVIVYDHVAKQMVASCSGPAERMSEDWMATLRALQSAYLNWMTEHPNEGELLRSLDVTITESQNPLAVPLRDRLTKLLWDWAKPRIEAGELRRLSRAQLYAVIFGPITSLNPADKSEVAINPAGWRDLVLEMAGSALTQHIVRKTERSTHPATNVKQPSLFER
jgi:AcrR family transcriptional regulator